MAFGNGSLQLPRNVRIEGIDPGGSRLAGIAAGETPPPTLRIRTHFDMGGIEVLE